MKDKSCQYEEHRILMARELRITPDDIDLNSLLRSVFRAIRHSYNKDNDEIIITTEGKLEEEAILSDYGPKIIERIFANEYPFEDVARNYDDWYLTVVLDGTGENEGEEFWPK